MTSPHSINLCKATKTKQIQTVHSLNSLNVQRWSIKLCAKTTKMPPKKEVAVVCEVAEEVSDVFLAGDVEQVCVWICVNLDAVCVGGSVEQT
jgi:hypothetical protein